ncbi:Cmx/CmrA family chloramphenicol efflux MFS transporter [Streptomyces sp. NPDC049577]|uniref:Cmx/CmrA family chloramphenicol efflux MFS transporter n=1 Tax=Streptomyces sp. NPDC049577 TaxID=3155153 RepID=UPI00344014B2
MPLAVYILALGIFAQGTSEFMLSGLIPTIADDLGVSIPDAGLLVSGFAVGMLVGAPLLAVATLRMPRRTALACFQAVFIAAHVVGALSPGYALLFATRVVSAVAYAGFWAVAAATAVRLVPTESRARAMSVVTMGLSLATVLGVPAGTILGQHAGWRAVFWAVAALTAVSLVSLVLFLPDDRRTAADAEGAPSVRRELAVFSRPRLWLSYGLTALSCGCVIAIFSYLAPLLTEVSGMPEGWVPAVLSLFGVGALVGLAVGGRTADARPLPTLGTALAGMTVTSLALWWGAGSAPVTVVLVFFLGLFGFLSSPVVQSRVFAIAGDAPTLVGAVNTSAFNVGITLAPMLGGLTIDAGLGYASVAWVGAAIAVAGLLALIPAAALERRRPAAPVVSPAASDAASVSVVTPASPTVPGQPRGVSAEQRSATRVTCSPSTR